MFLFNKYTKFIKRCLLLEIGNQAVGNYLAPSNLSYFWNYGSLAALFLILQILTGVFLSMHYSSSVLEVHDSIEHIMRNVHYGWLIRYYHMIGASFFFFVVYVHIFRSLYYGSYLYPRHILWMIGMIIFILMIAVSFLGYVLPWGQMSFWAATVITNLILVVPFIGVDLAQLLWGGFSVDAPTLSRFASLHFALPFVLLGLVIIHILFLHEHNSSNPLGVSTINDRIVFTPYYTVKDLLGVLLIIILFFYFVFYLPISLLDYYDNANEANSLVTPEHIIPEWYFLPLYTILRSIPNKIIGVLMLAMVLISLFIMPFLNNLSIFNSGEVRPFYRSLCFVFFVNYIILGILGSKLVMFPYVEIGKLCTFIFFLFFFFIFFLGFFENIFFVVNNLKNDNVDKKNINKGGEYLLFSLDNLNNFFKK